MLGESYCDEVDGNDEDAIVAVAEAISRVGLDAEGLQKLAEVASESAVAAAELAVTAASDAMKANKNFVQDPKFKNSAKNLKRHIVSVKESLHVATASAQAAQIASRTALIIAASSTTAQNRERMSEEEGVYNGQLKEMNKCGLGVFKYVNGDIYEGQFKANMKHGHGVNRNADGSSYFGQFKDDMRCGYGCQTDADGAVYEVRIGDAMRYFKNTVS